LASGGETKHANRNQNAWVVTKDGKLFTYPMGGKESDMKEISIDSGAPLVKEKYKEPYTSQEIYGDTNEFAEGGIPEKNLGILFITFFYIDFYYSWWNLIG